ncbi:MAG: TIGR01777 family oxidoreductase [Nitrospirota bacterium]
MKVLIGGGSGFIGQHLAQFLLEKDCEVTILDRHKSRISSPGLTSFIVDLLKPERFEKKWFDGVDAVVNLSGRDIFTFWTKEARKEIWDSRVTVNKNLIDFISHLGQKPKIFISASAVGFYGDKGETLLTETAPRGEGFLAEVCQAWEEEARKAENFGLRSVQVRTAPVLGKGGILKQMTRSFRFGVTFIFGRGNNWFSWIHMNDIVRIYHFCIVNQNLAGPVNACSPNPVRFREFINQLREFKKAVIITLPACLLKIALQETADVVLFSQRMVPSKLTDLDFQFRYPLLRDALKATLTE